MTGYTTLMRFKRLEDRVTKLGFRLGNPKHGNFNGQYEDLTALFPKEDQLPVYSRDAELFIGSLENLEVWLTGVEWARNYDYLLRLSDEKKRTKKEDQMRYEQLMQKMKDATIKTTIEDK